jgi:hypothetical protein
MREAGVEAYYEEIKEFPGIREEKGGNASRFPVGERLVLRFDPKGRRETA